jgi:ribonuclease Z
LPLFLCSTANKGIKKKPILMSKDFTITILGSSSAIPTKDRFPTAQIVSCYGRHYLLDCGEGTQIQLRKYKISFQRIDRIFISHLHADHFLGLPGLLSTMDLLGRTREIHIHAFEELNGFMSGYLKATHSQFSFPVHFHPMQKKEASTLFENDHITINSFPLKHAIPCNGFVFNEKPKKYNITKEAINKYHPSIEEIHLIKSGKDLVDRNGLIIPNESLTTPPAPSLSYAFVTDTIYHESIIPYIQQVSLLYHESTFAEDLIARAKSTMHSTAKQAATMAANAEVKKLMLGHYSVRYEDLNVLLKEAVQVNENTIGSYEGLVIELD